MGGEPLSVAPQSRATGGDQEISAIPANRGTTMYSTAARSAVVSDHSADSTPRIDASPTPSTNVAGSQAYDALTGTCPAHSNPNGESSAYFMSR